MEDQDTHKLQPDPPEGSREVIERELDRVAGKTKGPGGQTPPDESGSPGEAGTPRT
jgi:hypothetical protein